LLSKKLVPSDQSVSRWFLSVSFEVSEDPHKINVLTKFRYFGKSDNGAVDKTRLGRDSS